MYSFCLACWQSYSALWTESSHHGDQEEVRGRDLLQVLRVSVSESFDVNQGQHHRTGGDARFSERRRGGGTFIQLKCTTNVWMRYIYIKFHRALITFLIPLQMKFDAEGSKHALTWLHGLRTSCGVSVSGSGLISGEVRRRYLASTTNKQISWTQNTHNPHASL